MPTMGDFTTCPALACSAFPPLFPAAGSVGGDACVTVWGALAADVTELCRLTRTDSSPSWISISAIPDSSSISISFFTLRISILESSVLQLFQDCLQRQPISFRPETAYNPHGDIREIGMTAEVFTGEDIGDMHLDEGDGDSQECIAQCDACMRQGPWIDDDIIHVIPTSLVNPFDQFVFCVTLKVSDCTPRFNRGFFQGLNNLFERGVAVDPWLPAAKKIKIGSVKNQDIRHRMIPPLTRYFTYNRRRKH